MFKTIFQVAHTQICQKLSFRLRVALLLIFVISIQLTLVTVFFHITLSKSLEHQIRTKAVIQAREIAHNKVLIQNIEHHNVEDIQKTVRELQGISDADFIVIGNKKGIRLAHPDSDKVGFPMQGGDNVRALKYGEYYSSLREGSLGFAIRGKSAIINRQNEIIGVVSVGYLVNSISDWLAFYSYPLFYAVFALLILSTLGAWLFTKHIKQQMFDMEPEEIALSLRLQSSVLQSVYEGIIAVNTSGEILSVNTRALKTLGIVHPPKYLLGRMITEFVTPASFFMGTDPHGKADTSDQQDELITCNGETLIANRVNIWDHEKNIGWVVSFRRRDDINTLTSQISQIQQHTENLRVLSHEYANRLSTIGGLVQIGAYDEAIQAIRKETQNQQQLIDYIAQTFCSRIVAGLLLGKYSRAKELGLQLEFDPLCQMQKEPQGISSDELAAILGNLLDNAFEATLKNDNSNKVISLLLTDASDELVIEVADNGTGIPEEISDSLFTKGVSSKEQPGHGIGLYLVHRLVTQANGTILTDHAEPKGTIFSIFIPNVST
ncbi:ATP-binding protein [Vibrio mangrovi]|uniref:histidine kinase n=1 Tax=Vibrio mangrovi TaxID=474394 RepID=A0A1Y6INS4_9VIBR|nr:sensor histidine kinase [Vibrio mangrovi]MDW6003891.1 sensor histidine kinase [Vibrio mangrovi]SMR99315.1 Sensor histidine kinase DpiB [Vibrio mangrovi]